MDDAGSPVDDSTLPKYVRFARSLALVSGATIGIGIAVGATVFTAEGCAQNCYGSPCGDYGVYGIPVNRDASGDGDHVVTPDAEDAGQDGDDGDDGASIADAGTGGGPLPAPPLPDAWLA
jgi:hypothetical protein